MRNQLIFHCLHSSHHPLKLKGTVVLMGRNPSLMLPQRESKQKNIKFHFLKHLVYDM